MRRKKSGSSLIYVIIMFMFISVVSTAMLSMISANYTARVAENKRVENLYGSDSGIDVAYNIMGKTFDAATKYGYYRVKTLSNSSIKDKSKCTYASQYELFDTDIKDLTRKINDLKEDNSDDDVDKDTIKENNKKIDNYYKLIEEDKEFINILLNEEFKSAFRAFFQENDNKLENNFKLKYSIENKQYVYDVSDLNNIKTTDVEYIADNDSDKEAQLDVNISDPYNINSDDNDEESGIEKSQDGHTQEVSFVKTVDKVYNVKITSDFESENAPKTVGSNNRTVEATYVIKIPNYDDIFFVRSTSNDKYLALSDRSLTVGKNMDVENVVQLIVSGDVFVNGEDPNVEDDDSDRTYKKYSGGITINNDIHNNVEFKNDVITRNTFNIQDKTETHIEGNLYAGNVYVGKIADGNDGFAEDSQLYINEDGMGKVILDNDFTVKAKDSEIEMNDFYGINDNNINYKDTNNVEDSGKSNEVYKSSSSIIINGYKGGNSDSKVIINDYAYIMGTAHIATDSNYQTGESGAVAGNYIAYSVLDPTDSSETFDYDNPLYLLKEDNVFKKAKHFENYWYKSKNADNGGIEWPKNKETGEIELDNIFSVGAIVYKVGNETFVKEPHYNPSLETEGGKIYDVRREFASEVYKFGQSAEIGEYNNSVLTDFDSLIDLSKIPDDYDIENEMNKDGEKAIFNDDDDITLVLQDEDNHTTEYRDSEGNIINVNIIKADSDDNINAVIATAGDVIIDGNITFNGTIICEGGLQIKGNDEVTINYHQDVISRLQSQNAELFEEVFGGMIINNDETSTSNKLDEEILDTSYDIKKFLETKLWKLKK